jgi:hypothetical protein
MNKGVNGQRGMTAIGWLIVLGMLSFFVLLVLRLAPGYLEFYKVKNVIESLKNEPYIGSKTPAEIRSLLQRRIDVNSIDSVQAKDIKIEQKNGRTNVGVQYEVRVPILGNIDAVSKFDESIEVVAH